MTREHANVSIEIFVEGKPVERITTSGTTDVAFDRAIGALVDASTDYGPHGQARTSGRLRAVPDPEESA